MRDQVSSDAIAKRSGGFERFGSANLCRAREFRTRCAVSGRCLAAAHD
jgi:hypothetical protein